MLTNYAATENHNDPVRQSAYHDAMMKWHRRSARTYNLTQDQRDFLSNEEMSYAVGNKNRLAQK